jgi:hypothetical protein
MCRPLATNRVLAPDAIRAAAIAARNGLHRPDNPHFEYVE